MRRLFLDDERMPEDVFWITLHEGPWDIVRSQDEFAAYVIKHGIPDVISFDNDLGDGMGEGVFCARWLIDRVLDGDAEFPVGFSYTVHSKNNIAEIRIRSLIDQFLETRDAEADSKSEDR